MHFRSLFVIFVLLSTKNIPLSANSDWNYDSLGPDVWPDLFPQCAGMSQSPINIRTVCTTYTPFEPFQLSSTYDLSQDFLFVNNGHTIIGRLVNASEFPLVLTGGGLTEPFTFENIHLHYGENYNSGSEHQINGQKYAGEVHFVHANSARTRYAVLGMFMQSTAPNGLNHENATQYRRKRSRSKRATITTDNTTISEWARYFPVASTLTSQNDTGTISLKLGSLIGTQLNNFYRYAGSFTTPPCSELVIWSVFQTPIQFTNNEIEDLRTKVYFEDYRGPQPVNGRTVFRSFLNKTPSTISDYACCGSNARSIDPSFSLSNAGSIVSIHKQLLSYSYSFLVVCFFFF